MLRAGRFTLSLERPVIMGIVNVTPDSFSDGGQYFSARAAIDHGLRLIEEGAHLLDIGGESTRPGAPEVSEADELARVLPVIAGLQAADVPLSIDTQKPGVMRAALAEGAAMINDVNALRATGALEVAAASDAAVCLMHMQGTPRTMQANPEYTDVVTEVKAFLGERLAAAEAAGITRERLVIDPGFGFGKSLDHNVRLLRELASFASLGVPVLAGLSRKTMLGKLANLEVDDRIFASVAAAMLAVARGAKIIRVHDVKATRDALAIVNAVEEQE